MMQEIANDLSKTMVNGLQAHKDPHPSGDFFIASVKLHLCCRCLHLWMDFDKIRLKKLWGWRVQKKLWISILKDNDSLVMFGTFKLCIYC